MFGGTHTTEGVHIDFFGKLNGQQQKKVYVCTIYTCMHEYKFVFMCLHVYSRVYDCIQTQRSEQAPLVYIATDSLRHNSHIQCVNLGVCHDHLKMTHK